MSTRSRKAPRKLVAVDPDHRLSIVSGPKLRRYEAVVWDDEDDRMSATSTMSDLSFKLKEAVKVKCGTRERAVAMPSSWRNLKLGSSTNTSDSSLPTSGSSSSIASSAVTMSSTDSYPQTPLSGSQQGLSELNNSDVQQLQSLDKPNAWKTMHSPLLDPFDDPDKTPTNTPSCQVPPTKTNTRSRSASSTPYTASHGKLYPVTDTPLPPLPSPSFTLISLAEAQERERQRSRKLSADPNNAGRRTPLPHSSFSPSPGTRAPHPTRTPVSHHIKGKRSGFMRLINNKTPKSPVPHLPISSPVSIFEESTEPARPSNASDRLNNVIRTSPAPSPPKWSEPGLMPHLELRPVSMNLANGLPLQYLCSESASAQGQISASPATADHVSAPSRLRTSPVVPSRHPRPLESVERVKELEDQVQRLQQLLWARAGRESGTVCCPKCGHASGETSELEVHPKGIMDRGRVKTGRGVRGVFGAGSCYEREGM